MTKPQIWVAAFLVLFILLFILARVTKEEAPVRDFTDVNMPTPTESAELSGEDLVTNFGCTKCHGSDLSGTTMGPALKNLSQFWSRDNLINYLRNPSSYMDSDRFKDYKERFPNMIMPSYANKDVKDLGKISDYLLTK